MRVIILLIFSILSLNTFTQIPILGKKPENRKNTFTYSLDVISLKSDLLRNARENRNGQPTTVSLKNYRGENTSYSAKKSSTTLLELENQYPENRTFELMDIDGNIFGYMCTSNAGARGAFMDDHGLQIFESQADQNTMEVYPLALEPDDDITCGTEGVEAEPHREHKTNAKVRGNGLNIRTYRLAVLASGEYSNARSNNLSTINADLDFYIAVMNTFYGSELAINFIRVTGNNLVFTDPVNDGLTQLDLASVQTVLNANLASNSYDLGHAFGYIAGGGSGVASLGVVCNTNFKGRGWSTAVNNPTMLLIHLHEIGHMFNTNHSFYGTTGNCGANGQRAAGSGYEPGAGNTLMSYSNRCGLTGTCPSNQNILPSVTTTYFNTSSINAIVNYVNTNICAVSTSSNNDVPVVTVPANRNIPINTPFELVGNATDANPLRYVWEEFDTDNLALSCPQGSPNDAATSPTAPLFRSFDPTSLGFKRTFPKLSDIINNTQTIGEILPAIGRNINMRLMVRDDLGAVEWGTTTLTSVATAGPFVVNTANTSQNYNAGQALTVTWSVNNTNVAPISCANVAITFSTDGGLTYPITLLPSTPNDGSQAITLPSIGTTQGRIKIAAIGNYFFDINNANITLTSGCNPPTLTISATPVSAAAGSPLLVLNPSLLGVIDTFRTSILSNSPTSLNPMININNTATCVGAFNSRYTTQSFTVSVGGNYSLTTNSAPPSCFISVLSQPFNAINVCENWLNSNTLQAGSGNSYSYYIPDQLNVSLAAGQTYYIRFGGNIGSYKVSYVGPGSLSSVISTIPGFNYTFVAVNTLNNLIVAINTNGDLTALPAGSYAVYGLIYSGSPNLSSYLNGNLSGLSNALSNGAICGAFTSNQKPVTITGCTPSTKTITSNADDGGPNTLRSILANVCTGDIVVFNTVSSLFTLNSPIVLAKNITIDGAAVPNLTYSGNNVNRIFEINQSISVTLRNIKMVNASTSTNGGAIWNKGILTLQNVTLENNFEGATRKAITNQGAITFKTGNIIKL